MYATLDYGGEIRIAWGCAWDRLLLRHVAYHEDFFMMWIDGPMTRWTDFGPWFAPITA